MPDDLSPAELRRVRKAIRAAHAKGVELGRAEGRREAATLLEYAARLNGSTPHAVAVLKAEDAAGHEHGEHGRFASKGQGKGKGGGPGGKADRHPDGTSRRENPHPRARAAYRAVRDYLAENGSASGDELAEVVKDAGIPPAKAAAVVDGFYNRGLVTEGEGDSLALHAHAGKAAPALAAVKEYLADYGEADPAELVEHLKDGGLSRGAAARALQDLHHSGELVKEGGKFKLPPAEAKALGPSAGGPGSTNTERAPDPAGAEKRRYGCVLAMLTGQVADTLGSMAGEIRDEDLADDGREDEPHVTVRYGLHTNDPEEVRAALADSGPVRMKFGGVSVFPGAESGKDYDVLKVDVLSPDLERLHAKLDELDHTDTHAEYRPHATLAYVKAGLGQDYADRIGYPRTWGATAESVVFSDAEKNKTTIPLTGEDIDPHRLLTDAMLAHAEDSLAAGDDPAPGLGRLRALADDPGRLAEVLAAGGADAATVGKCWLVIHKAMGEEAMRETAMADEMLAEMGAES